MSQLPKNTKTGSSGLFSREKRIYFPYTMQWTKAVTPIIQHEAYYASQTTEYNGLQNQPDRFELKYKILRLIQLLISNSRSDEIEKAVNNKNYRNQPFDEFGL